MSTHRVPLSEMEIAFRQRTVADLERVIAEDPSYEDKWGTVLGTMRSQLQEGFKEIEAPKPRIDYHAYIRSEAWRAKSEAAKDRAGRRCQVCNSPNRLNSHHRTYERLGHEEDADLVVLCESCHTLFHENGKLAQ